MLRRSPLRWPASAVMVAAITTLAAAAAASGIAPPTALSRFDLRPRAATQVRLPGALREVSGLAAGRDGTLYAHGDERGVIQQFDPASGRIVRSIPIGDPPVRADLEGIAVAGRSLVVLTSDGQLYHGPFSDSGRIASFVRTGTGLGRHCELEGLAFDPANDVLLIGCKVPRSRALGTSVTLFRWSLSSQQLGTPDRITLPRSAVTQVTGVATFHPSSVEVDPATGHYIVAAGRERALLEITPAGEILAGARLSRSLHRQPEGLTFLGDSLLLVADEAGRGRPTLTAYRRVR